jgi:photosystem II stability/assembly factor-like uncharacterized protein
MFKRTNILCWVIAACGTVIFLVTSVASSQTWTSLDGPYQPRDVRDIASSSDGTVLYAVDKTFLFKSTNGGTSWAKTGVPLASPLVVICKPDNPDVVVVGISNELVRNSSGGTGSWVSVLGPGTSTPLRLAVSVLDQNLMYLGKKDDARSSLWHSPDGGASWIERASFAWNTDAYGVATDPLNVNRVWVGGSDPAGAAEGTNPNAANNNPSIHKRGVWLSTDRGVTWIAKYMGDFNVRAVAARGAIVYAGTASGKVARSTNTGGTWSLMSSLGASVNIIRALRIRKTSEILAATNAGLFRSTNNDTNWTNLIPSGDNNILAIEIVKDHQDTIFATTAKTVWKSTDGGNTWSQAEVGLGRLPEDSHKLSR